MNVGFATVLLCAGVLCTVPALALELEGSWRLNFEETDKVTIRYEEGSGIGRRNALGDMNVSVMGLPLPSVSSRIPPRSGMAPKDPEVLLCNTMTIDEAGKRIAIEYDQGESETLVKGDYRGRKSTWSKRKIEQRYRTPDRKVKKTWTLRDDGRLLVSVRINPRGDRARTFNRVFDRITAEAPTPAGVEIR